MADIANDNWINIEESAEHLGVKQGTIRDWIRKDKGGLRIKSVSYGNPTVQK